MAKKEMKKALESKSSPERSENIQKILVENFVSLQEVMAKLSERMNNLTEQISKLLELFEESAKAFMEKDIKIMGGGTDKEVTDRLDKLLEQNKLIARGITLIHDSNSTSTEQSYNQPPQPPQMQSDQTNSGNVNKYQKSIF
ncbi:MAG: hypothetical protein WAU65_00790 [Candidatus Nanoarchaeia archaeon]